MLPNRFRYLYLRQAIKTLNSHMLMMGSDQKRSLVLTQYPNHPGEAGYNSMQTMAFRNGYLICIIYFIFTVRKQNSYGSATPTSVVQL